MTGVVVVNDDREGGEVAAGVITDELMGHASFVLGIATGSTPLTTWTALAQRGLDLSTVRAFALDEYIGLAHGHPQSFGAVVAREVTVPLGLDPRLVQVPAAVGEDPELAAVDYERDIAEAGGIDVQVLGIGRNGHVAFNEPGSSLTSTTRVARLSEGTRRDNARFFSSLAEVPTHCITQGIGTIFRARKLVLLAFGTGKAAALAAAVEGSVSEAVPASIIQWHPDAIVIADRAAASMLTSADAGWVASE